MPDIINQKNKKIRSSLQVKLDSLPTTAGIYQFKDKAGKIIYIGKAKNLRSRVRSYFVNRPVGVRLERMISLIRDVEIINTDSEVESLILEMNLIQKISPRYNVNLKDDKSFPYIVITNEPFPRVFPTRKRRNDGSKYFGPYTDVGSMKYSLKMLRDIYMIRTCSLNITQEAVEKHKFKVCLEYHIQKCDGPCEGFVSRERYCEMIAEVEKALNGKTGTLIRELGQKMTAAAQNENFEEASILRNRIQSLEVYTSKQKVISKDFSDKDVINYVCEGDDACAMILNIRDGKVVSKRHFYLDTVEDKSESEIIERVLFTYYSENNYIPDEIHLPNEIEDLDALKEWFKKKSDKKIDFIFPKRGEKMQLLSMVKTNARYMLDELKLQRLKREFIPNSITALKRDLRLTKLPRRIECFDISNIQGTDTVASMVVFEDGRPKKSDYRKFKIRATLNEVGKPDDFASMREVIYRRFRKIAGVYTSPPTPLLTEWRLGAKGEGSKVDNPSLSSKERETEGEVINRAFQRQGEVITEDLSFSKIPDLIVIDGGKGQLSSAVHVLYNIGIKNQNIIGLAKKLEEVFVPGVSEAQSIPKTSSGLKLLQRVRDEAHRFAITFHRSLRDKRTIVSELEGIKGIGKLTAKKLLIEFGSVEKIKQAMNDNSEDFEKRAGKKVAERLKEWVKSHQ